MIGQACYLKFIKAAEVDLWDVRSLVHEEKFSTNFKVVYLKDVLYDLTKERREVLKNDCKYSEPTISSKDNSITPRKVALGKDFKVKNRIRIEPDDLVISRMHTQAGLYAIARQVYHSTGTFIPLKINAKIDSDFLRILLKPTLARLYKNDSVKRETYKTAEILDLKIPLPPLSKQIELVEHYQANIRAAESYEAEAQRLETNLESDLFEVLGIEQLEEKKRKKGLQFVQFKDLDRWDVTAEDIRIINGLSKSKYSLQKIGEVYDCSGRSWLKKDYKEDTFKYIELGSVKPDLGIVEVKEIHVNKAPSRATQQVKSGDLIIGTTRPYLKRFAIVESAFENCICSSGFYIIKPHAGYNLYYLKDFLMSYYGVEQFKNKMTGATYPAITNTALKEILIPLPPSPIQQAIADHFAETKTQIKQLRREAKEKRRGAKRAFEGAVFGV